MATYATTNDVQVSLGRALTTDEATRATGLLTRVENRIIRRLPDLTARVAAETTYRSVVVEVESDAVARVLRNPEGYTQEQDGDYLYIRDRTLPSGLSLTDEEWARLGVTSGAFSVTPWQAPDTETVP